MKVRTQTFGPPGTPKIQMVKGRRVYSRAVTLITLDQFLRRARVLGGLKPRQALTELLRSADSGTQHEHHYLNLKQPDGSEVLFWMED